MGVWCGVCAGQLGDATENEGSFSLGRQTFAGWDADDKGRIRISDTCESCATKIQVAIAVAASIIAAQRKAEVDELRTRRLGWEARWKREAEEKLAFERE